MHNYISMMIDAINVETIRLSNEVYQCHLSYERRFCSTPNIINSNSVILTGAGAITAADISNVGNIDNVRQLRLNLVIYEEE